MCTFLLQNGALWDICLMHNGRYGSVGSNKSIFRHLMNWSAKIQPLLQTMVAHYVLTLFVFMHRVLTFGICINPVCNMNHITRPRGQWRRLIARRWDVPMGTAHSVYIISNTRSGDCDNHMNVSVHSEKYWIYSGQYISRNKVSNELPYTEHILQSVTMIWISLHITSLRINIWVIKTDVLICIEGLLLRQSIMVNK